MARRALVEILGNAAGFKKATKESIVAAEHLDKGLKKLAVDAKASANAQVAASIKRTDRMKMEARAFRQVAAAAKKGSREQVEAANMAARSEAKLARAIGKTNSEARHSVRLGRSLRGGGKELRGGLASTGMAGGRALAFSSLGFLGAYGAGSVLKGSVNEAARIQEETEKTTVLFGKSEKQVQSWAKTLATSFGVSEGKALETTGTFGNMFRSLHFGEAPAAKMSERLVELGADMASFNNASPEDTLAALSSGLAGQVRPLRAYGVFLSQARIKQEAVSSGMVKNAAHLTTAQKVQAAYNIILKDTALQQGDVARNSASLSVAQSKAKAAFQDSEAIIGAALLPHLAKLATSTARYLEKLNKTGRLQRGVNSAIRVGKAVVGGLTAVLRPLVHTLQALSHVLGGARNTAKLFATVFIGMKVMKWAAEFKVLAATLRGVAAAETLAGGAGGAGLAGGLPKLVGGAGALAIGGVAGAALAFGQRGETSSAIPGVKAHDAQILGDTIGYKDPLTGKHILFNKKHGESAQSAIDADILRRHPELKKHAPSPEDVRLRGAGSFATPPPPTTRGRRGGGGTGKLGLIARFGNLETQLGLAKLTGTKTDDRKVLEEEKTNLMGQVARLPKDRDHLKDRLKLLKKADTVQSAIDTIDKAAAAKKKAAEAAKLALKKKELAEQKKHNDKVEADEKKKAALEKKHHEAMKKAQAAVKAKMQAAVDDARSLIGGLFSGPILNPTEEQKKRKLGVAGPDAHKLVADVIAQTKAFRGTSRDLGVLRRAGASKQLIGELEGTDPEQLHALATASPKVRKQFLQAFAQRQKAIQSRARFDIHSPHVNVAAKRIDIGGEITVIVHTQNNVDGREVSKTVTKHQQKHARHTAAQRGGRHPGTVHGIH